MMLRIHFTFEDLARTRIAGSPDPMWETILSAQLLQNREGSAVFRTWRRYAHSRLGVWAHPLLTLAPNAAYFPDFLTPPEEYSSAEQAIDTVLSTSRTRLRCELEMLAAHRRLPAWCRHLADGDVTTIKRLGGILRSYHNAVIQPYWTSAQSHVEADRARCLRSFHNRGFDGLLANLGSALRWRPPILEADYPVDRDLHLNGEGLLLVPSFFCWRTPVALVNPELRPVLVYPVDHGLIDGPDDYREHRTDSRSLAVLLGRTRAAILRAAGDGCTTTELSHRVGTSISSASQHATALRKAGLLLTRRNGTSVLHTQTPLGVALITASFGTTATLQATWPPDASSPARPEFHRTSDKPPPPGGNEPPERVPLENRIRTVDLQV